MAGYPDTFAHIADELRRLDLLLRRRLATTELLNDLSPETQIARTAYISRGEVDWLLTASAATTPPEVVLPELDDALEQLSADIDARVQAGAALRLPALGRLFDLSPSELLAVVICLAPELHRKYDRLYAYLQDDITRRRPSVDLVLDLLCADEQQRWRTRRLFDDAAPLLRLGLLRVVPDPASPSGRTDLARTLALDPRICQYLLGADELDGRLVGLARLDRPVAGPDEPAGLIAGLARLAERHDLPADRPGEALVYAVHGPDGAGKRELAGQVSARLGRSLLVLDLRSLGGPPARTAELVRAGLREARLQCASLCLSGADALARDDSGELVAAIGVALRDLGGLLFLTGVAPWSGGQALDEVPVHSVTLLLPDRERSISLWRRALPDHGEDRLLWAAELADRFRLPPAGIRSAVAAAERRRLSEPSPGALTLADLYRACREQSAGRLSDLAVAIRPACGWDDLVLPADRIELLRDIAAQVRHHRQVFDGWGFGGRGSRGTGLSALFGGPPGTGKTMAAEVLAGDLGLDLYKVDLAGIVSKYIGETEKNLRRVFTEARTSNAILFFDEADALFGKRTEVSDAHDRYANIETSFLLQQMEEYDGVVVLATNLRQNLDEAFTRRIRFIVEFPFPDVDSRARIWRGHFPARAPIAPDVDVESLAREFAVAGGTIKNIVLSAAFLAAADGGVVDRRHILRGTQREYEKIGRLWSHPATGGDRR